MRFLHIIIEKLFTIYLRASFDRDITSLLFFLSILTLLMISSLSFLLSLIDEYSTTLNLKSCTFNSDDEVEFDFTIILAVLFANDNVEIDMIKSVNKVFIICSIYIVYYAGILKRLQNFQYFFKIYYKIDNQLVIFI